MTASSRLPMNFKLVPMLTVNEFDIPWYCNTEKRIIFNNIFK